MPKREPFKANHYYHLYNKSKDEKSIFLDNKDFEKFLWYLKKREKENHDNFEILAFCILPNHFHLVVHSFTKGFEISKFIGNICSSYTKYFFLRHKITSRPLFNPRFKSKNIEDETYLKQCIHYVEHNAMKHGIVDTTENRPFCSYNWQEEMANIDKNIIQEREFNF